MTTTPQSDWEKELEKAFENGHLIVALDVVERAISKAHKNGVSIGQEDAHPDIREQITKARNDAFDEAIGLIKIWHIKKGGFTELAYQVEQLKTPTK